MGGQFHCYDLQYSEQLRAIFQMSAQQIMMIDILGPIALVFAVVNILCISIIKTLKEPPSDILLFINIMTVLKIGIFFTTIIYNRVYPVDSPLPSNFDAFCSITGVIDVFSQFCKFILTVVFCIYYITKLKNPLKAWINEHKEVYFVSFFLVLIATCILYYTNNIGISIYGFCGLKFSKFSQYTQTIFTMGFLISLVISSIIFLKYLKSVSKNDSTFRKYFMYYFKFLIIFSINELALVTTHILIAITCSSNMGISIFNTCQIISKINVIINPVFIFVILINHPHFKRVMLIKILQVIVHKWRKWRKEHTHREGEFDDDLMLSTNRNTILIELTNLNNMESGYLSQIKNKGRACLLSTILGCIVVDEIQQRKMHSRESQIQQVRTSTYNEQLEYELPQWSYHQKNELTLNQFLVNSYQDIFLQKLPVVSLKYITYAPSVFARFREMNRFEGLAQQLSPQNNQKQIIKDSNQEGDGGRSGQFFFFSRKRSVIMKTVSSQQQKIYLSRLQLFNKHYELQKESLIVKVYSMFTILNESSQETINFMLMGNILKSINRKFILRVYDLKGSTLHREVIKGQKQPEKGHDSTLKDLDFVKLEQKVWIRQQHSNFIKNILTHDCKFLCRNGLIDYSLLAVKVNIEGLLADEDSRKDLQLIKYYRSVKEDDVAYIFGIIDYLQTWNIKKKGQKWYKSLFNRSDTISSQDPTFYCNRFISNVIEGFFP